MIRICSPRRKPMSSQGKSRSTFHAPSCNARAETTSSSDSGPVGGPHDMMQSLCSFLPSKAESNVGTNAVWEVSLRSAEVSKFLRRRRSDVWLIVRPVASFSWTLRSVGSERRNQYLWSYSSCKLEIVSSLRSVNACHTCHQARH